MRNLTRLSEQNAELNNFEHVFCQELPLLSSCPSERFILRNELQTAVIGCHRKKLRLQGYADMRGTGGKKESPENKKAFDRPALLQLVSLVVFI